jgi:hypothetical protein
MIAAAIHLAETRSAVPGDIAIAAPTITVKIIAEPKNKHMIMKTIIQPVMMILSWRLS